MQYDIINFMTLLSKSGSLPCNRDRLWGSFKTLGILFMLLWIKIDSEKLLSTITVTRGERRKLADKGEREKLRKQKQKRPRRKKDEQHFLPKMHKAKCSIKSSSDPFQSRWPHSDPECPYSDPEWPHFDPEWPHFIPITLND